MVEAILLEIQSSEDNKRQITELLRMDSAGTNEMEHVMNTLKGYYAYQTSIWWYAKEAFLYSLISRALKTKNTDILCQ
ncbi:unnamed protein product, partial [Rotaria sp. Silwood1]